MRLFTLKFTQTQELLYNSPPPPPPAHTFFSLNTSLHVNEFICSYSPFLTLTTIPVITVNTIV